MPSFFTERTEPGPCLRLTENKRLRSDRSTSGPIAPGALREPPPAYAFKIGRWSPFFWGQVA